MVCLFRFRVQDSGGNFFGGAALPLLLPAILAQADISNKNEHRYNNTPLSVDFHRLQLQEMEMRSLLPAIAGRNRCDMACLMVDSLSY